MATNTSVFPRTYSVRPSVSQRPDTKLSGFGGFPTPFEILRMAIERFFPKASMKLSRTMTMPRTNSIAGRGTITSAPGASEEDNKEVPYISFQAIVGRNSRFHGLTEEQMDELGGVEYRALRVLLIIVCAVSQSSLGLGEVPVDLRTVLYLPAIGRVCHSRSLHRRWGQIQRRRV